MNVLIQHSQHKHWHAFYKTMKHSLIIFLTCDFHPRMLVASDHFVYLIFIISLCKSYLCVRMCFGLSFLIVRVLNFIPWFISLICASSMGLWLWKWNFQFPELKISSGIVPEKCMQFRLTYTGIMYVSLLVRWLQMQNECCFNQ